jgi:hypothetical protein
MTKRLLILCFLLCSAVAAFCQSDFMQLKKGNKTLKTFMPGSYIVFQLGNYQWLEGEIQTIRNDTFYIKQVILRRAANWIGMPVIDTGYLNIIGFHVNEIYAMPRKPGSFEYVKNGSLFMIGGGGYLLLNTINTLSDKEPLLGKDNRKNFITGAGTFLLGLVLNIMRPGDYIIGKKYKLSYIRMHAAK